MGLIFSGLLSRDICDTFDKISLVDDQLPVVSHNRVHAAENAIQFGRREGQVEFLQTSFELGRINRATAGCTGELEEGPEMRRREGRWLVRLANGETYELWERREGVLFWERGRNSVVVK